MRASPFLFITNLVLLLNIWSAMRTDFIIQERFGAGKGKKIDLPLIHCQVPLQICLEFFHIIT